MWNIPSKNTFDDLSCKMLRTESKKLTETTIVQSLPLGRKQGRGSGKQISTRDALISSDQRQSKDMASRERIQAQENGKKEVVLLYQPHCTVVNTAKEKIKSRSGVKPGAMRKHLLLEQILASLGFVQDQNTNTGSAHFAWQCQTI